MLKVVYSSGWNYKSIFTRSLVDVKPIRDPGYLEGKELEFKIVKMDERRNNIVVFVAQLWSLKHLLNVKRE